MVEICSWNRKVLVNHLLKGYLHGLKKNLKLFGRSLRNGLLHLKMHLLIAINLQQNISISYKWCTLCNQYYAIGIIWRYVDIVDDDDNNNLI